MKVKSQGQFPSGALRAPTFLQMHLDTLEGGEKIAGRIKARAIKANLKHHKKTHGPRIVGLSDDVIRKFIKWRDERKKEKRASTQGST